MPRPAPLPWIAVAALCAGACNCGEDTLIGLHAPPGEITVEGEAVPDGGVSPEEHPPAKPDAGPDAGDAGVPSGPLTPTWARTVHGVTVYSFGGPTLRATPEGNVVAAFTFNAPDGGIAVGAGEPGEARLEGAYQPALL